MTANQIYNHPSQKNISSTQCLDLLGRAGNVLDALRKKAPHIHCLTNTVAEHLTANVLLALGVTPYMSTDSLEVATLVKQADGLLINLGTPDDARRRSYEIAARTAQEAHKPFVLDPVFVERSPRRLALAKQLISYRPTVVRANAQELEILSISDQSIAVVKTGIQDMVAVSGQCFHVDNGSSFMAKVTGMGCALGAVIAACLAVHHNTAEAIVAALLIMGVAGERADQSANKQYILGPGSFSVRFLDQLYALSALDILKYGKIS